MAERERCWCGNLAVPGTGTCWTCWTCWRAQEAAAAQNAAWENEDTGRGDST